MTNEEIQRIFFLECEEALTAAEGYLATCRAGQHDDDTINGVFRAVHSIKGGAGAFGLTALQHFTHGFETTLSDVRDGVLPLTLGLTDLLLRALDMLNDHFLAVRDGEATPDDSALLAELEEALVSRPEPAEDLEQALASKAVEIENPVAAEVGGLDFDLDAMMSDFDAMPTDDYGLGTPPPETWTLVIRPLDSAMANGGEPVLLLRELQRLGGCCQSIDISAVPDLSMIDPAQSYFAWTFAFPTSVSRADVDEIFDFVDEDFELVYGDGGEPIAPLSDIGPIAAVPAEPDPAPARVAASDLVATPAPPATAVDQAVDTPVDRIELPESSAPVAAPLPETETTSDKPAAAAAADDKGEKLPVSATAPVQSIRIDLSKLDKLIDTVGELVIAQAMMAQRLSSAGMAAIEELAMLDGLTRDIQESAMAIRAQPIASVFSRVPRMLRELQHSTGKRVRLEMVGEATELDKTVIERLSEPLTHLIRNAVDHGIESPEDRVAAGKAAEGVLVLSAEHRSGRIVIKVTDDGKGIDRTRVFAKAVERGLISADATLSDEEIDNLIFTPGFSTAATISNISGRGVGMDVVRQNVKDLGGRISIESKPGKGSCFSLALPLTLAISDGMIVTVGDQTLVVPLTNVVESLRPDANVIANLGSTRQMLNVRGQFIPVISIERAVGALGAKTAPTDAVLIVVETETAGQAALMVDNIRDQRQFVIKSLDTHYRSVDGVAGATILGDGRVALILDVDTLVTNAVQNVSLAEAA